MNINGFRPYGHLGANQPRCIHFLVLLFLVFLGRDLPLVPLQILPRFVRRSPLPMVFDSSLANVTLINELRSLR